MGFYRCSYINKLRLFFKQGYKPKYIAGKYSLLLPAYIVIIFSLIEGFGGGGVDDRIGAEELKDTVDSHADMPESPLERKGGQSRDLSLHKVLHCVLSAGVWSLINSRSLHVSLTVHCSGLCALVQITAHTCVFSCFS